MHGNLARQELANKDYFGRYSMESMGSVLMRRVPAIRIRKQRLFWKIGLVEILNSLPNFTV
jgi:hypothetical protein